MSVCIPDRRVVLAGLTLTAATAAMAPAFAAEQRPLADTSRLLVAGGAITEIVYALGLADRIVAVDSTSLFPPEALKDKKNVGYFRALSTEGVLSMAPTAILASDKAGPPEVVRALKASATPYVEIDDRPTPDALLARVAMIAAALGVAAKGAALSRGIAEGFTALDARRRIAKSLPAALFVLSYANGRAVVGGKGTAADAMLELAGVRNVAAGLDGYKPLTDEGLIALAPEAIVVAARMGAGGPLRAELLASRAVGATPAGARRAIVEMDGLYLLGFGPRAPQAAAELMDALAATTMEAGVKN